MKQLTMQDLKVFIQELENKGYDLDKIQVYLGDDDELNGVHNAWNLNLLDKGHLNEDTQYVFDLIEENYGTSELKKIGVLIS